MVIRHFENSLKTSFLILPKAREIMGLLHPAFKWPEKFSIHILYISLFVCVCVCAGCILLDIKFIYIDILELNFLYSANV